MSVDFKDYYKILGVGRTATDKEIKSSYRKLARKYHPDVNPGDKGAEEKFKEINEAHAVLTDPEKRKKYDTLGPNWERRFRQQPGTGPFTQAGDGSNPDFSDFFETLFGRGSSANQGGFDFDIGSIFNRGRGKKGAQSQAQSQLRGADLEQPVDVTLMEAHDGVTRTFTVERAEQCATCKGTGLYNDAICQTCHGTGTVPRVKRLEVKIPAGVKEGSRIRVTGEGNPGLAGGPAGDLFLLVRIAVDSRFRREADDLYEDVQVPVTTLVLGGEVEVPTLKGRVTMRIPSGSQNGRTLRLPGQGMPQLKGDKRGDLYVKLTAVLPTHLDDKQRALFQQLAQAGV